MNTYSYSLNNPVNYYDPNGQAALSPGVALVITKCATGVVVGTVIESVTQIGKCCYKQCGAKLWKCDLRKCDTNLCNIAVSAFASCVASAAMPNAPAIPVTWSLLKPFLQKFGLNGALKALGKWGCK